MQVREIMTKEVVTIRRSTTLKKLLQTFAKFHIFPLVPVIEDDNRLVGIVSFRNLLGAFGPREPAILKNIPFLDEEEEDIFRAELTEDIGDLVVAEDIMETKFISIREDASLEETYKLMKLHLKDEFPVIDKAGKLVGIVGIFDIMYRVFRQKGVI